MFKESQKSLRQGLQVTGQLNQKPDPSTVRAWRGRIIKKRAPVSASFCKIQKQQITFLSCLLWERRNKVTRLPRVQSQHDVRKPGTSGQEPREGGSRGRCWDARAASGRAWVCGGGRGCRCVSVCCVCAVLCVGFVVVCPQSFVFLLVWVCVSFVCVLQGWVGVSTSVYSCLYVLLCVCVCVLLCVCVWWLLWGGGLTVAARVWQQPGGPAESKQIAQLSCLLHSREIGSESCLKSCSGWEVRSRA